MTIIELSGYNLKSGGLGNGLKNVFFSAEKGDVWKIESDNINDGHLLVRALATLSYPVIGTYYFDRKELDFSDYRNLLPVKKRIAYVASDSTLISNRTIRENLSINRNYFNNDLSSDLTSHECAVCDRFNIASLLDVRPSELKLPDIRRVILIREMLKEPDLILIESPDDFSGFRDMDLFVKSLQGALKNGAVMIYNSYYQAFVNGFTHNTITIKNGLVSKTRAKKPDGDTRDS